MMRRIIPFLLFMVFSSFGYALCQEQEKDQQKEQQKGEMPKLEIPEMTIVGKKAITLPFARKGEVYGVDIYQAPPPDSSLLGDRPTIPLPLGSLPRWEERRVPWHAAVEGSLGSFATGRLRGNVDYGTSKWSLAGSGGYGRTNGHTGNATANAINARVCGSSLVETDNEVLKTFRLSGQTSFSHDSYGMFGIRNTSVERNRSNIELLAGMASLYRQGTNLSVDIGANIWRITDSHNRVDSEISAVSPRLTASFTSDFAAIRLATNLSYTGSSLNSEVSTQSPSLLSISSEARWSLSDRWLIHVGLRFGAGSDVVGNTKILLSPIAKLACQLDASSELSIWSKPDLNLSTYDEEIQINPYLARRIDLRPQRTPVNFGSSLSYSRDVIAVEVSGEYTESSNTGLMIADSGAIHLEYVDAVQTSVQITGSVRPIEKSRIKFSATLQPSHEKGRNEQLPMIPLVKLQSRGEYDLTLPMTVWSSLEYRSSRNVDRQGLTQLGSFLSLGAGVSSSVFPRSVVSLEILNLLNSAYEWWGGYVAPGREIVLEARLSLR